MCKWALDVLKVYDFASILVSYIRPGRRTPQLAYAGSHRRQADKLQAVGRQQAGARKHRQAIWGHFPLRIGQPDWTQSSRVALPPPSPSIPIAAIRVTTITATIMAMGSMNKTSLTDAALPPPLSTIRM